MTPLLEDFLQREESRRNRSLSKRFRTWLSSDKARPSVEKLERALNKSGNEGIAVQLLKKCEESYKADDVYRRQDGKRKKSLKQFQDSFEKWLTGYSGLAYQQQISNAKTPEIRELAKEEAEKAFARANPHLLPDDYKDASKTRIRPVRHARAKGVDDLSFDVIEPGLNQLGLVSANIMRNWEGIVGSALSQNTRAERVVFPPQTRTHGTLFIQARQGFNTIVQHNTSEIIFRINSHFGFKAIAEVKISKRYFEESQTTGKKISDKLLSQRVTPAEELSPRISQMLHKIEDPDLRKAFEDLGKIIKARNG